MEFLEFFEKKKRMCSFFEKLCDSNPCKKCELSSFNNGTTDLPCTEFIVKYPERAEAIIAKWAAEHPKKTRQSEFLKMFPRASLDLNGVVAISPCDVDTSLCGKVTEDSCTKCGREYWLAEVE
jgi:hypothetical protein